MGFIKFGSRVDVVLPVNVKLNVKIGDNAVGGITVLATW
jgi:phosphatidylserine decarboxylase